MQLGDSGVSAVKKHLERGLSSTGLLSPEEAARLIFTEVAKYADRVEFSSDGRALIADGRVVIRPSKSSGLALDLRE